MTLCPCSSGNEYAVCCEPYLQGLSAAPTAEALMRSRYTAYTKDDYGYVIRTCHSSTRPASEDFEDEVKIEWTGLEIVETEKGLESDDDGVVEFIARYSYNGNALGQHERSNFVKEDGEWFYVDGEFVKPPQARSEKIGRNQPCTCGSGKKYKKCCYRK
ncbi:MAG: SEC-C domain-containing protein [Proteobacteria bacterium]|nr:SEC-C domain-containing protein [Pseudomonadota bacterium]MBU1737791.1 SEC-C domain-containing protein [Pseudomonadota bacterium]